MATQDGIHAMLPREQMNDDTKLLRDTYAITPNAPIVMREFGFYSLDRWTAEGKVSNITDTLHTYGCTDNGRCILRYMGGCTAEFFPQFEVKVLEDRGDYELVQDFSGRSVLYFKGRRNGFMPEYVDHPVKDIASFEANCKWRMQFDTPERQAALAEEAKRAVKEAQTGKMMVLYVCGAYMYLRSLIGPEELLYAFYDDPDLIHACMQQWLELNEQTIAYYQQHISVDEILLDEDICYNHGLLISPEMWRSFLKPYYAKLIEGTKARNLDRDRHVFVHLATDGDCRPAIPLYEEIGMDCMSPFEVASGCDVVAIAKEHPNLRMFGGFDKRILAAGPEAIDREVDRILPFMKARGGYIPTCDHGVPEEVDFENWVHFRKRLLEFA